LSECSDEKEEIEEKFELIVKNFGYKSKQIVFGIFDQIILVVLRYNSAIEVNFTFDILNFFKY